MRFHWLLSSFLGIFLFCLPAKAGKLISWEFETQDNNLVFITDEGVQPEAQLLTGPTRLVIDLPGTTLGRETIKENYSGAVRGFRIGQPEPETSRIVVELAPGYTIDPDEIEFRGVSSTQWSVKIPTPKVAPISTATQPQTVRTNPATRQLPGVRPAVAAPAPIEDNTDNSSNVSSVASSPYVTTTRNGFFISIDGSRQDRITSSREGDRLNFDMEGVILPEDLAAQSVAVAQYGVDEIEFTQTSTSPPVARMSLKIAAGSPDWLATFSRIKGLILIPRGKLPDSTTTSSSITETSDRSLSETTETVPSITETPDRLSSISRATETEEAAVIKEIELVDDDTQLRIRGDRDFQAATTRRANGVYEIKIDNAELSDNFKGPRSLEADGSIAQIRVREEGTAVAIAITTKLRYRLGQLEPQNKAVAFPIQRGAALLPDDNSPLMSPRSLEVPQAESTTTSPLLRPLPPLNSPMVVIDAGHGGQDPGTMGNGLVEKDIVLPISLDVAEILRKQGIDVKMTRDSDYFVSLEGRTDYANEIDADLFVSIHANAINLSRPDVNGLETYYYKNGRRLAETIHWSILNGVNIKNRNIRRARFYVLRHSVMPAVLVEVGFVTGAEDAPKLKDPNHRRQMAEAIARGIILYIKENNL
ncbi:N-acetylmuramoyl-L-alanine amidase [Myxosarcina sp. GI1]|uniref:N-acetylmuramoyl-L-alanine amidase n=1 Tax=Myxosarcina sp. GI1 TaxID=1541065 RepID=UPI00055D9C83|nr:N-acetylmuramoyl-L-alanine amidase [Myxosarcina sp. GI1]